MQLLLMFLRANARKLMRYAGVSVIGVISGQTLLWLFHAQLGWGAAVANATAVCLATLPNYLLNRAWVWGKRGSHSVATELIPFWGMAFLGLLVSTALVHYAESRWDTWVLVNVANLCGFGMLWVARFFVLDRVLFRHEPSPGAAMETPA
jgi:putative flippase GtrA